MSEFLRILGETGSWHSLKQWLEEGKRNINVYGLPETAFPSWLGLLSGLGRGLLVLTDTEKEAQTLQQFLEDLLGGESAPVVFPENEIPPYRLYARSNDSMHRRIRILDGVLREEIRLVIAPMKALMEPLIPPDVLRDRTFSLHPGDRVEPEELLSRLVDLGYEFREPVEHPGQFSHRGGILDIYSLAHEAPVRLEFFDDEVDSLRSFDPETQRSTGRLEEFRVLPARELQLTPEIRARALLSLRKELKSSLKKMVNSQQGESARKLEESLKEDLDLLAEGGYQESLDRWMHLCYPPEGTLLNYLGENCLVTGENLNRLGDRLQEEERLRTENYLDYVAEGLTLPSQREQLKGRDLLEPVLSSAAGVWFSALPRRQGRTGPDALVEVLARGVPGYLGKTGLLADDLRSWLESGRQVYLSVGNRERLRYLEEELEAMDLPAGQLNWLEESIPGGFELPEDNLVFLGEKEIFSGAKPARKIRRVAAANRISAFTEISQGDYVVHVQYGIGRYLGITHMTTSGTGRDYLEIEYAREDKLFIPVEQLDLLERYVGSEGRHPRLSRLGTQDWERAKSRVRNSVRDIAGQLISLYASREMARGFAFDPDTVWQKEFEEKFPYQETADQMKAIEDVKRDMESFRPMDRIVVGDVGYGKTEVALRAAFKAVMNSKQVAVLVPTTVLASQHHGTFVRRFSDWPVRIEVLNRFRSARDQKEILARVARGEVDILIGTHRILSRDVAFQNLGLVVVDEEQKFGVVHKEKLKEMRREVDFLTLTATPIPRTLHMSLSGARDMSVIETPPEDRLPVQTYVLEDSDDLIANAIRRELEREGQVYYVHNRVGELETVRRRLSRLVPGAIIEVAHGQMAEQQLEESMLRFVGGQADILLCTTIVENGLDISNVNTLIVADADRLGLSQIYQLKGRIGRSSRKAFAYFTYRASKVLTEVAEKRLRAIREFTEFGSGFRVAMRDLEIRGAGNLLGAEQHGHMLTVGFEMYTQLLEEEVARLRGQAPVEKRQEMKPIPLPFQVDAFLPATYIPAGGTKMDIYKRLLEVTGPEELSDLTDELVDRFGDPPPEAETLLELTRMQMLCRLLSVQSVEGIRDYLAIRFSGQPFDAETLSLAGRDLGRDLVVSLRDGLEIRLLRRNPAERKTLQEAIRILERLQVGSGSPN